MRRLSFFIAVIVTFLLLTHPGSAHELGKKLSGTIGTSTPAVHAGAWAPSSADNAKEKAMGIAALAKVKVTGSVPDATGYDRSCRPGHGCVFGPAWTDVSAAPDSHNGCDTRNDVLREQLTDVTYRDGSRCVVATGTINDPYTGSVIRWAKTDATALQVDHLVPLGLVWDMGAKDWTLAQRATYANDTRLVLILADGSQNESKGDKGPSQWMPPNTGYACTYASRYAQVVAAYSRWGLVMSKADHDKIATVLAKDC